MKLTLSCCLLLLASCSLFGGLSNEEEQQVSQYQERAEKYFYNQDFEKAIDQLNRGLRIDADNYKLNTRLAWCFIRLGRRDPNQLLQAEQLFKEIIPARTDAKHDAQTLLGYGLTLQGIGTQYSLRSRQLREESEQPHSRDDDMRKSEARAEEFAHLSKSYYRRAEGILQRVVKKGEFLALANEHLFDLQIHQHNYAAACQHAEASLQAIANDKAYWEAEFRRTTVVDYERHSKKELSSLRDNELRIRSNLANQHFQNKEYAAALAQQDAVLALDPNNFSAYYDRGRCYRELGMPSEAKGDFEKFLGNTTLPAGNRYVQDAHNFIYPQ